MIESIVTNLVTCVLVQLHVVPSRVGNTYDSHSASMSSVSGLMFSLSDCPTDIQILGDVGARDTCGHSPSKHIEAVPPCQPTHLGRRSDTEDIATPLILEKVRNAKQDEIAAKGGK